MKYGVTRNLTADVTYNTDFAQVEADEQVVQYNSSSNAVSANARLRWEYRPGSELFVVFNEQRDTLADPAPSLANRSVVVKINRLFRF